MGAPVRFAGLPPGRVRQGDVHLALGEDVATRVEPRPQRLAVDHATVDAHTGKHILGKAGANADHAERDTRRGEREEPEEDCLGRTIHGRVSRTYVASRAKRRGGSDRNAGRAALVNFIVR